MAILDHQGTGSTPRSVQVCYVANEVALGRNFHQVLRFLRCRYTPTKALHSPHMFLTG